MGKSREKCIKHLKNYKQKLIEKIHKTILTLKYITKDHRYVN